MEYYWKLTLHDGSEIDIPPSGVDVVNRKIANREVINTRAMTIPYSLVKSFKQTDKRYVSQDLLEGAAQAFNDPVYNDEGDMMARWVKRTVPMDRWNSYYSKHTAYKKLREEMGMITVAFVLPVHTINPQQVDYCTTDEINTLEKYLKS